MPHGMWIEMNKQTKAIKTKRKDRDMEKGESSKTAADAICKTKYSRQNKTPKRVQLKYPDTLAENEAAARELGLSYGMYMGFCESGYIDTYRKMYRNQQKRVGKKRRENVIESGIIGTASGFRKGHEDTDR